MLSGIGRERKGARGVQRGRSIHVESRMKIYSLDQQLSGISKRLWKSGEVQLKSAKWT